MTKGKVETRAPRIKPVDQTKFDYWLMQQYAHGKTIEMHFSVPPRNNVGQRMTEEVTVIDVDKFMVLLEFPEGECFWVSKSIIASAGLSA
jgi:hypothetical protein